MRSSTWTALASRAALKGEATRGEDFIEGNAAAALGCVYGGRLCAWYRLRLRLRLPRRSEVLLELRVDKNGKNKFAIVQARTSSLP